MSSTNVPPSGSFPQFYTQYFVPPLAAGAAVVPIFYGFMLKSALQCEQSVPRMPIRAVALNGLRAAPTVGGIIGTQIIVQDLVEQHFFGKKPDGELSLSRMLASSAVVGAVSVPLLAIFNAQSIDVRPIDALRQITWTQSGAIVLRELSFLAGLRLSQPLRDRAHELFGESKVAEHGAAFMAGNIGSQAGHLADTALTRWQSGLQVHSFRQLFRGGGVRSLTVGAFSMLYNATKDWLSEAG